MTKLLSFQESVRDLMVRNGRTVLIAPPGVGMDVTSLAALKEFKGSKLIVDTKHIHAEWRRLMAEAGVDADVISPEKLVSDFKRRHTTYEYDNVVWNVTSKGRDTRAVMRDLTNRASKVIVRRLVIDESSRDLMLGFKGDYRVISLISNTDGIYPVVNERANVVGIKQFLGLV